MKYPTYSEIFAQWSYMNPWLLPKVDDYRPADGMAIRIWFDDGVELIYSYRYDEC